MPTPPKAVLYDIGNVIVRFDFKPAADKIRAQSENPDLDLLPTLEEIKLPFERGDIDNDTFITGAIERCKFTGTREEFIAAWEDIFTLNQPMVESVATLAKKLPLYILSNTSGLHMDYILRTYPVFDHFKDSIYSYAVKMEKPEPEIYDAVIKKFGIAPSDFLYIDDRPENAEAGRAHGFRTHQYDPDNHAAFLTFLKDEGLEI